MSNAKTMTCFSCRWSFFNPRKAILDCKKKYPGCPDKGEKCSAFERYAGAEND